MTEKKKVPGKPFVKADPRINRNGRPKSFDALRKLAQQMSHEVAKDRDGNELIRGGHKVTIAEMVLFQMLSDKKQRKEFLEIALLVVDPNKHDTGLQGFEFYAFPGIDIKRIETNDKA